MTACGASRELWTASWQICGQLPKKAGAGSISGINMLVNRENIDEILKMARLAGEIGLKWLKFNPALPGLSLQ